MLLVFTGTMVPIWYLSRYTVMGADDYYYGLQTYQAWIASGSLMAVLRAAAQTAMEYWHNWQGTYSSIFLMTLTPGIFGDQFYFLTTFIMTGMVIGSVAVLGHVFLKYYAGCKSLYLRGISVLVLLFLIMQTFVSAADGIYWYNGALHYVFMQSVLLFMAAVILAFRTARGTGKRVLYLVLAAVLGFLCGGANLLTALQSLLLYGVVLLADLVLTKKREHLLLIIPFLVNLAGFMLNVLAPGNTIRETTAEGMGAVLAIVLSFYWALVFIAEWMTPIVLAGFLLLLPVIGLCTKDAEHKFIHPLLAAFVSYCVFAAMFTPTLYAMGSEGPDRCKNVMRIMLYLLVFANLVNGSGYLRERKKPCGDCPLVSGGSVILRHKSLWMSAMLCGMLFLFLFAANKNTYTSISALRSIANGEAARYYEENQTRLALYQDPDLAEVTVQPLTVKPYLLYKTDVGNEGSMDYWVTLAIEKYYQKKVTVEE